MNHQHLTTNLTSRTASPTSMKKENTGFSSWSEFVQVPHSRASVVYVQNPDQTKMPLRELSHSRSISSSMSQEYAQKRARYSVSAATQRVLEWQQEQQRFFEDSMAMPPPPPFSTVRQPTHQSTHQPTQKPPVPPRIFGITSQSYFSQPLQSSSSSSSLQSSLNYRFTATIPSPPQSPGPDFGKSRLTLSRETSSSDLSAHTSTAPRLMSNPLGNPQVPPPQVQLAPPQAQPVLPQAQPAQPPGQLVPPQAQMAPPQAQSQPAPPQTQPSPMSWNECVRLPLGRLPRLADCRLHNKHLLAQIPFRTSESRTPGSMYRHFFLTLAPNVDVKAVKSKLDNCRDLEYEDYGKGIYNPCERPPNRPRPPKSGKRTVHIIKCFHLEKDGTICGETMLANSTRKSDHCMKKHAATWQALNDFRSEQTRGAQQGRPSSAYTSAQLFNPDRLTIFDLISDSQEIKTSQKCQDMLTKTRRAIATCSLHLAVSGFPFRVLQSDFLPNILAVVGIEFIIPPIEKIQSALEEIFTLTKSRLNDKLVKDVLRGCYTCDIWTYHHRRYVGVTFRYLDWDFKPQAVALGFEEFTESATAQDVEKHIVEKLRSWDLHGKTFPGTAVDMNGIGKTIQDKYWPNRSWVFCLSQKMRHCIEEAFENSEGASILVEKASQLSYSLHTQAGANHLFRAQKDFDIVKFATIDPAKAHWYSSFIVAMQLLDFEDTILLLLGMLTANKVDDEQEWFWAVHGDSFLDAAKFKTLRQVIDVLRPAAEFIEAASGHGPEVSRLYPKIKEILDDEALPLAPEAVLFKESLRSELKVTFPFDKIPDETLMATFLNPVNVGGSLLEMEIDGIKLVDKAEGLLKDAQEKLLELNVPLYTNVHGEDSSANYTAGGIQRRLRFDLTEYRHFIRKDDACDLKMEEWWKNNQDTFPALAPLARIYLSVQASPADSKPYIAIVRSMFTKENRPLGSQALRHMVLLKSWFNCYVKGIQERKTEMDYEDGMDDEDETDDEE